MPSPTFCSATVNPAAKLAMSFPRSAGQCPISYAEPPTGRPLDKIGLDVAGDEERDATGARVFRKFTTACRLEGPHTPLYPFGHGLSYSKFDYGPLELDKTALQGTRDTLTAASRCATAARLLPRKSCSFTSATRSPAARARCAS